MNIKDELTKLKHHARKHGQVVLSEAQRDLFSGLTYSWIWFTDRTYSYGQILTLEAQIEIAVAQQVAEKLRS